MSYETAALEELEAHADARDRTAYYSKLVSLHDPYGRWPWESSSSRTSPGGCALLRHRRQPPLLQAYGQRGLARGQRRANVIGSRRAPRR